VTLFLFFAGWGVAGYAQQFCSHAGHMESVYQNPLFERWLSKYDMKFYHIALEVSNENTMVDGHATLLAEALVPLDTLVLQFNPMLEITGIEVDSLIQPEYDRQGSALYIPMDKQAGEQVIVKVVYNGDAATGGEFFSGISNRFDSPNQEWVTYTLSEPLSALDWFPVKQVLHDKIDSAWMDFTCDQDLMVGSNGVLEAIEARDGNRHTFKWRSRYPIAYYLLSFSVGNYRDYSFHAPLSDENDSVLVQNFIYNSDEYLAGTKEQIDETGDLIHLFSELVLDYPFADEKYGHAVAPMGGGMEHQTMTTLQNFRFTLVAHELAHQWFGDYVTCGTWQDIWINEGFASYFEYIALQNLRSQQEADNWMSTAMYYAGLNTEGSVYVPEEEVENVSRVFDYSLSYKKGAVLLHMIRYILDNDETFFNVLREYQLRFADSVATAVNFRTVLENVSNQDFSCFFDQYYYGKGYPRFNITWHRANDTLYIRSEQTGSSSETPLFNIPFDLEAIYADGKQQVFRLYQSEPIAEYSFPESEQVTSLVFDPRNNLLATGSVRMDVPGLEFAAVVPNPFINSFQVVFKNFPGEATFQLYNLKGQSVMRDVITSNPYQFNMTGLSDGPYIVIVESDTGRYTERIVKAGSD
jgi:aminopeptidase N